ncbi:hypothetical protein Syun_019005 [Stephania yunnanensis]|uniref:Uncharacterized protein n=1 Tax=Stephania yunnanensis TaxID=152371 RepID=A0AAP0NWB1_9MAGN
MSCPISYGNSPLGSPVSMSRYQSAPLPFGIAALLHDHASYASAVVNRHVKAYSPSLSPSASVISCLFSSVSPISASLSPSIQLPFPPPPPPPPLPLSSHIQSSPAPPPLYPPPPLFSEPSQNPTAAASTSMLPPPSPASFPPNYTTGPSKEVLSCSSYSSFSTPFGKGTFRAIGSSALSFLGPLSPEGGQFGEEGNVLVQKSDEASKAPESEMSELVNVFLSAVPNSDKGRSSEQSHQRASFGRKSDKVQLSSVVALVDFALDVDQVDNLIKFYPTKKKCNC